MTAHPLLRSIRWAFIGQALAAAGLMIVVTLVGSAYLRDHLLRQRAVEESIGLWQRLERNQAAAMPRTTGLTAYFLPAPTVAAGLPPALERFPPGQHFTGSRRWRVVQVSERPQGRLYVFVNPALTNRMLSSAATLFALVALLGVGLLTWASYRRIRDLVMPVRLLSDQMRTWDPEADPDPQWRTPAAGLQRNREVESLRASLTGVAERMKAYMERERRFTRDASHELRTPLTVVRMASELLAGEPGLSPRGHRSLQRIRQATGDMEELAETFLLLARDPNVPVDVEEVHVLEVASEEADAAREQVGDRPLTISVVEQAQPVVHAPPRMLGVLIRQLLRNAVRFTDAGRIDVVVEHDRFSVRDTGIGMDEQTLQQVFEPFYRADIADTSSKGMGLPVVKRLADRFGWQVAIHSVPGEGTTVSVRFA